MRIRDTSLESWEPIAEVLGPRHAAIYEMVARYPDQTTNEIFLKLRYLGNIEVRGKVDWNLHSRMCELRDMGCIYESGRRHCSTSGRLAVTWRVTGRRPMKDWRRASKGKGRRPLEDTILDLREEIQELKKENSNLRLALKVERNKRRARRIPITKKRLRPT